MKLFCHYSLFTALTTDVTVTITTAGTSVDAAIIHPGNAVPNAVLTAGTAIIIPATSIAKAKGIICHRLSFDFLENSP